MSSSVSSLARWSLVGAFTEPCWVVLTATHPLAAREQIAFQELWDEPFVAAPTETGWWHDW